MAAIAGISGVLQNAVGAVCGLWNSWLPGVREAINAQKNGSFPTGFYRLGKKFDFSHMPSFAAAFSTSLKGSNDISFSVIISAYIF